MSQLKNVAILLVITTFVHAVDVTSCDQPLQLICSSDDVAAKCGKTRQCLSIKPKWNEARQRTENEIAQAENDEVHDKLETLCKDCTAFVTDLAHFMTHDAGFLEKAMAVMKEGLCKRIFAQISLVCDALVDNYGADMMQGFVDTFVVKQFCIVGGDCEDTTNQNTFKTNTKLSKLLLWQPIMSKKKKNSVNMEPICGHCFKYFKDVKELFGDKLFQAQSIDFVNMGFTEFFQDYQYIFHGIFQNITSQYLGAVMDGVATIPWELFCEKYFCEVAKSPVRSLDEGTLQHEHNPITMDNEGKSNQHPTYQHQSSTRMAISPIDQTEK